MLQTLLESSAPDRRITFHKLFDALPTIFSFVATSVNVVTNY